MRGSVVFKMATGLGENIMLAKVTSMFVLGSAAFVATLIPVFINRRFANKNPKVQEKNESMEFILTLFLSFGGGVLLCTTFLHLLPEVTETIEDLQKSGKIPKDLPLPLPELVMCCGFFIMYIVEEVVHKFLHDRQLKQIQGMDNPIHTPTAILVDEDTITDAYKNVLKEDMFKIAFSPPHEEDIKIIPAPQKYYGSSETNCHGSRHADHDHHPHDHHDHHTMVTNKMPSLRELLIVLALTVHEAFEGVAIGLEPSVNSVWYLMAAVAVHKCVIAFCIGVELVSGQISLRLSVFYAFIYSCASPFGIGMGLLLTSSGGSDTTVILSVVLQGIATGTLLYVVFFEILKKDPEGGGGLVQMIVVIVGFTSMGLITVFLDS